MRNLRKNSGFTAVEIAMVATVIAILALLVLPLFRQRAEDAKLAAAQDEVQSLAKALILVEADMPGNFLPRLNDLDNKSFQDSDTLPTGGNTNHLEPPRARWLPGTSNASPGQFIDVNDPLFGLTYPTVVQNWFGPYIAMRNTVTLNELLNQFAPLTDSGGNVGPIAVFTGSIDSQTLNVDRYPVDPWGTPYLLFGPEETIYNFRVVYSLGPDAVPGSLDLYGGGGVPANAYDRRQPFLGAPQTDDISFEF